MRSRVRRRLFYLRASISRRIYTRMYSGRSFIFQGKTLEYAQDAYNYSWRNERSVEIPIFRDALAPYQSSQILEVGAVLRNYMQSSHVVIDKYEQAPGVLNVDVIEYAPGRTFDMIVAISTLEHVGWDETPKEPAKVRRAIDHLRSLLSPAGMLMVSFPIGYNSEVNTLLANQDYAWDSVVFLQRVSRNNIWREVPMEVVLPRDGTPARFNQDVPTATAIAVCTIGAAK